MRAIPLAITLAACQGCTGGAVAAQGVELTVPTDFTPDQIKLVDGVYSDELLLQTYAASVVAFEIVSQFPITDARASRIWEKIRETTPASGPWDCSEIYTEQLEPGWTFQCYGMSKIQSRPELPHYGTWEIWFIVKECVADSPLVHEFLHVLSGEILGYADPGHVNPYFHVFGEGEDGSAEALGESLIRDYACGDADGQDR